MDGLHACTHMYIKQIGSLIPRLHSAAFLYKKIARVEARNEARV